MATRLFVGNLPDNIVEADLHTAFSGYGEIKNLDLKSKSAAGVESKIFAFVTISGSNYDIESCIKHFSSEDFKGKRLYVTRARESFLERLQRERLEAQEKKIGKVEAQEVPKEIPVLKLGEKLNPHKRKRDNETNDNSHKSVQIIHSKTFEKRNAQNNYGPDIKRTGNVLEMYNNKQVSDNASYHTKTFEKENVQNDYEPNSKRLGNKFETNRLKQDSDMKRIEAMKKKRQEFKEKQMIVKTGLISVDKVLNKKIIFSDNEDDTPKVINAHKNIATKPDKKNTLFDEDNEDSDDEFNFEIKKQFEGKSGQKVLDLQSRYKSDKRFVLDERFIEEEEGQTNKEDQDAVEAEDQIEVNQKDERDKQLNILQDVLGVPIKRKIPVEERENKKNKPKLGMLRFDPYQPEHAKFLAPVENRNQESTKKSKKKKDKQTEDIEVQEQKQDEQRPEVSKEQFYKVSDSLKEAIAQPTTFSLRSLFGNTEVAEEVSKEEKADYIPLATPKKSKVKNPLEPGEKNPFIYDSSDSETEEVEKGTETETAPVTESKAFWKENFFFGLSDQRFDEGLAFFNSVNEIEHQKERRELKSLMKKRIYNKERKDQMQMFQKKIGGRKKSMKKSFRRKN